MQRFTISLDDDLAHQFDHLSGDKGYVNRSEAVRDLIRTELGRASLSAGQAPWCVANVSYVYDHHDQTVTSRVMDLQHDHHDLVITSLHTHLDHDHCMETLVLRGRGAMVRQFAEQLVALRGIRNGNIHIVPLQLEGTAPGHHHGHSHGDDHHHDDHDEPALPGGHVHLKPLT